MNCIFFLKTKPMKKFLAVFDGLKMSETNLSYAIQLAKSSDAQLTGLFLDEFIYRSYNVYRVMTDEPKPEKIIEKLDKKDQETRDESVREFQKRCGAEGISYKVRRDTSIALQELRQEGIFADLIIISEYETFNRFHEKPPTHFIQNLLADVHCPVLVTPGIFRPIDKIIALYDGGPSSVYAIKMFSYLLGTFGAKLPMDVLTVKENFMPNQHVPDNKLIRDFLHTHFPDAKFTVLKGEVIKVVSKYLDNHAENELIVLGAYRRSDISRWFKPSLADSLIENNLTSPLFIAHNK